MKRLFWTVHVTLLTCTLSGCAAQEPCTTTEREDGSVLLQCGDEPPVTIAGPQGPAGEDGAPGEQGVPGEDGELGQAGIDGEDGQTAAIRTEAATSEQCAYGGEVVYTGYDSDGSGALEAGEETQNFIICQGAPGDGKVALVVSSQADLNDCPTGGRRVEVGLDDDQSGALEADEILDAFNICNGVKGDMGEGGASALIEVVVDGAVACPAGGDLIHVGVDADGDGTLSSGERSGSFEVCDGQDGASCSVVDNNDGTKTISCTDGTSATVADGGACSASDNGDGTKTIACEDGSLVIVSNGNNALVAVTHGGAQACSNGGDLVQVGPDEDGDGVLAPAEVSDTFEVCRGIDGSDGQDGMNGAPGVDGMDGANGQDGAMALVSITTDGAQNCPAGGDLLEVGVDTNANGLLDANEVDASFEVCEGQSGQDGMDGAPGMNGQDGAPGQDGSNALLRTIEGGATTCPDGGDLIQAGVDDNNNGTLDASEVDSSIEVCDGEAGADGQNGVDGQNTLLKVTEEPPGTNCETGGQKIEVGLDQNSNGELDIAEIDPSQTAYLCDPEEPSFKALEISTGGYHTCAITLSGGVKCWGLGNDGQLGNGSTMNSYIPKDVNGLGATVVSVAAGDFHTCAVTSTGGVKCWGNNIRGQLGNGTTTASLLPVDVVGLTVGVEAVYAGRQHTCAVTSTGGVKCWGWNDKGQLGNNTTSTSQSTPVDVVGLGSGVSSMSAGFRHTCALTSSGGVLCWGDGPNGELGNNTNSGALTPVNVNGLGSGVASITSGYSHNCVGMASGGMKCWGLNALGQLGDGTSSFRNTPVDVVGLASSVITVAAGGNHTCAALVGGGAECWGQNNNGQLGNGGNSGSLSSPTAIVSLTEELSELSGGSANTCALLESGNVKCWGSNANGASGNLRQGNVYVPEGVSAH